MEQLLPYYERELIMLRRHANQFAARYPKVAAQLALDGEQSADPQTERLIQSVALLAARVAKRIDDGHAHVTQALLELLLPHYLQPFPSCAIAQLESGEGAPRGAALDSAPVDGVRCTFRTVYPVDANVAQVVALDFDPLIAAPPFVALPPDACAALRIQLHAPGVDTMRLYIDGEAPLCAALRDALCLQARCAWLEADSDWFALPALPLSPAGFAEHETLLPCDGRSHPAQRLLTEYFAFSTKFNFVDIDVAALRAVAPVEGETYVLHVALAGAGPASHAARMLRHVSASNLLAGCTPLVNLFERPGEPVSITHEELDYAVLAHAEDPAAYEVLSVTSVHATLGQGEHGKVQEFRPFYSLRHGEPSEGCYWMLRTDEWLASSSPGYEKRLSLVDAKRQLLALEPGTLSLRLTCSNRDLPTQLRDEHVQGDGVAMYCVRMPSPSLRPPSGAGLHWRMVSHLALNQHALAPQGVQALREMLALYDVRQDAISQRQIAGVKALSQAPTTAWLRHVHGASLAHGVEVRLTLDEEAYAGSGISLFIDVLDHFFGLYVQVNSFVELVALSARTGKELKRCPLRSGYASLV
ncbi:MAG: type VI secretion system baseplate subunit TssF [Burkholderiaceae bacterium]|nr:type VI secretion system baseplate subunit TssF [Burkholderiaceae bacterium]